MRSETQKTMLSTIHGFTKSLRTHEDPSGLLTHYYLNWAYHQMKQLDKPQDGQWNISVVGLCQNTAQSYFKFDFSKNVQKTLYCIRLQNRRLKKKSMIW